MRSMRGALALGVGAVAAACWAGEARAAAIVVPPRPGQVGIGIQGQYGTLLQSGGFGDQFSDGPGLAVRLRYRMRYERALGLSFESQRFDAREPSQGDTAVASLTFGAYGFDVYQMFGTRTTTTRMVGVGVGLIQSHVKLNDGTVAFTAGTDGLYVSASAGVERFFWQSWAIDLSGKYLTVFHEGKTNHDLQASAGLILYASY